MIGVRPVQVRQDSITRWLQRRAMAVRSLRLRGSGDLEGALVPVTERPQPAEVLEHPRIHDFNRRAALLATLLSFCGNTGPIPVICRSR